MYLKPPSSVEYSMSFLFMAQNWSNLSVTGQTSVKNLFATAPTPLLHFKMLRLSQISCLPNAEYQKRSGFSLEISCFTWKKKSQYKFYGIITSSRTTEHTDLSKCFGMLSKIWQKKGGGVPVSHLHWSTWIYWSAVSRFLLGFLTCGTCVWLSWTQS